MLGFSNHILPKTPSTPSGSFDTGLILVGLGVDQGFINSSHYPWVNPSNIASGTTAVATCNIAVQYRDSQNLWATSLGLSIPASATIDGVEVEMRAKCSSSGDHYCRTSLWDGSAMSVASRNTPTFATSLTNYTVGGPSDTWGLTLTPTIVNSVNFGAEIHLIDDDSGTQTSSLEYVKIKVYYTVP